MGLDERIGWFLIGAFVGFVLGYIVRLLKDIKGEVREVKGEVHEVDDIIKRHNEEGFTRNPIVLDVILLVVVVLTVWSSFASASVSNDVQNTQENQIRSVNCNKQYLRQTIIALNQRTAYVQKQAAVNVDLQTDQHKFFQIIFENPRNDKIEMAAFKDYLDSLENFVKVNRQVRHAVDFNPYPTAEELSNCIEEN